MDDEVFIQEPVHSHLTGVTIFSKHELLEYGFLSCHRLYYDVNLPIQNHIFCTCKMNAHLPLSKLYCSPFQITLLIDFI
jgi:hypothetical protein